MEYKLRKDGYSEYFAVKNKQGSPYEYTLSLYCGDVYNGVLGTYNIWDFNELTIQKIGLFFLEDKKTLDWITYMLNLAGLKDLRNNFFNYLYLLRVFEKDHIITSDDIKMFLGTFFNLKDVEEKIDEFCNNVGKYPSEVSLLSPKGDEKFSNAIEKMFKNNLDDITISINEDEDRNKEMLLGDSQM